MVKRVLLAAAGGVLIVGLALPAAESSAVTSSRAVPHLSVALKHKPKKHKKNKKHKKGRHHAPTTTTTTGPPAQAAPIHFSGSGQQATTPFTVTSGLAVISATYSGTSNFSVTVNKGSGSMVDIPINVIGSYSGSVFEGLAAGSYVLSVTGTTGSWSVTITQPRKIPATALPHTYTGHGQMVVGPFSGDGALRIAGSYNGTSNFAVQIRAASDGSLQDIPINVIGSYSGSTLSHESEGGPYYAEVDGTGGTWSLAISAG